MIAPRKIFSGVNFFKSRLIPYCISLTSNGQIRSSYFIGDEA